MPIVTPTLDDLMTRAKRRLREAGLDDADSSVAVLLMRILAEELVSLYAQARLAWQDARLSEATDEGLDRIGEELKMPRLPGEDSENYRFRLSEAFMSAPKATEAAIRQRLLQIDGVQAVLFRPYVYGPGSGAVILVVSDPARQEAVRDAAQAALQDVVAMGSVIRVLLPRLVPVRVAVTLQLSPEAPAEVLRSRVRQAISQYIGGLLPGQSLVVSELIERMKVVDDRVVDVAIDGLWVGGKQAEIANVTVAFDERLIPDPAPDGIAVR